MDFNQTTSRFLLENQMHYVTSVAFWSSSEKGYEIVENGTVFFASFGKNPFMVTAGHVYERFVELKQQSNGFKCTIGEQEFDLGNRLIGFSNSQNVDIATFDISADELRALGKVVTNINRYAEPVTEGCAALFSGFPGLERAMVGSQEYSFGLYAGLTPITVSSENFFRCVFDRDRWFDSFGKGLPPAGFKLGGISGGPVFHYKEGLLASWELVGVISEATIGIGEILTASRTEFILPNGEIRCPAPVIVPVNSEFRSDP